MQNLQWNFYSVFSKFKKVGAMSPVMLEEAAVQQAASRWQARHPMRLLLIYEFLTPPTFRTLITSPSSRQVLW